MQFSISTQSFYGDGINFGPSLPADATKITGEQAEQLYQAVNNGCYIYMVDGVLVSSGPRPGIYHSWSSNSQSWAITDEDAEKQKNDELKQADAEKKERIDQANGYMNDRQWPGKAAIGRLKGGELAGYGLWLDYLDALYAVDASAAPDIEWPTAPES